MNKQQTWIYTLFLKNHIQLPQQQVQTSSNSQQVGHQVGMSKVFILDKYFNELQKFWDTEKRLKGKQIQNFEFLKLNEYITYILV